MKRIVLGACGLGILLGVVWWARGRDWYASGAAVPPRTTDLISDVDCRLTAVTLGEQSALDSTVEFTWSQYVPVSISAEMDTRLWFWRLPSNSWDEKEAHMKRFGHLPNASFRISVVRRSSLSPGEVEVSMAPCNPRRVDDNHAQATGELWIPHVPGTYRVRVFLRTFTRNERDRYDIQEDLVAVFPLRVLPGAPAQ